MKLIDETAATDTSPATRTWLLKGEEARAVADAYELMNMEIQDISGRFDAETKGLREAAKGEIDAIQARHQEEINAAQASIESRLAEAAKPYQAEAEAASAAFHGVLWGLNPEMGREKLPMINLNQYAAGSDAIIVMESR